MPPRRTVRDEGFPMARGSLSWVDSFSRDASKVFRVVFCREGRQQSDEGEGRREESGVSSGLDVDDGVGRGLAPSPKIFI